MMNQMIVLTLGQQVAPRPERAARITIAPGYGVRVMRNPGEKDEHQSVANEKGDKPKDQQLISIVETNNHHYDRNI